MKKKRFYLSPSLKPIPYGLRITMYTGTVYYESWAQHVMTNIKVGYVEPKYEEIIANLQDATNPYSRVLAPVLVGSITPVIWRFSNLERIFTPSATWVPKYTFLEGYPHFYGISPMSVISEAQSTDDTKLDALAVLAFLGKVRDAQASFSSLTFLGELKETIGMLKHPLKGFTKATYRYQKMVARLKRVRNRQLARRGRTAGVDLLLTTEIANRFQSGLEKAYLQWTYGVAPLINDVEAMMEIIPRLEEKPKVVRLSVTLKNERISALAPVLHDHGLGRARFIRIVSSLHQYSTRIRGALKVDASPPESAERLRELTKFNLREVIPTAYELLPFSFLVDYFSTLGSVVNGVFTNTSDLVYAVHTRKRSQITTCVAVPILGTPYGLSCPLIPAVGAARGFSLNRVKANLSVSLNSLQFTMPNLGQWINTAVLATQSVRRLSGDL